MRFSFFKNNSTDYFKAIIILSLVIGIVVSIIMYHDEDQQSRETLISRAQTLSVVFSSTSIEGLSGTENDLGTSAYNTLKNKLISIHEVNPFIRFVYVMGKRNGERFFFADSEDPSSKDYSPPGQVYYEKSDAIDKAFEGFSATEGPLGDRWGSWVTGTAPIRDANGKVVAIIGIDTDAKGFIINNFIHAAWPFILSLVFASFGLRMLQVRRKEQKLWELKHQFISIASHELRSPLKGISWALSSLVSSHEISQPGRITLEKIQRSISHLLSVVNDLLKVEALEAKKKAFTFTTTKLSELVDRVIEDNSSLAEQKKITIAHSTSIPTNAYVKVDTTMMFEAISNVLSNAIKYSPEGSNVVVKFEDKKENYQLAVIDHGIGIPKEAQTRVFEGFYRASNAQESKEGGTGLGLYFVKKVVEAHQGTVGLISEENKGTTIEICIPKVTKI